MPDKLLRMSRADTPASSRPVMLAIGGDSAAGKTTLTEGLVAALGPERCTSICADDYHKYDRAERKLLPFTPLHPDCNYIDILEQHLQLLALGRPILKPVYDHATGTFTRPEYVEPKDFVIVEGLHPLSTKLTRACFDIKVFLDPPEEIRRQWKVHRDSNKRGYTPEQVLEELVRREPESKAYIQPQRRHADIVIRFAPLHERDGQPGVPLSAEMLLRPTIRHPSLSGVLSEDTHSAMHLKIIRDPDGTPVDALHVHGDATPEQTRVLEEAIWADLAEQGAPPSGIGQIGSGQRSEPLALAQLILLYHMYSVQLVAA
jgi:phosphoribulokinase